MALHLGQQIRLRIEKPVAGGWMLAREGGQVVLVAGAIPDEVATVRIERLQRGVGHARVVAIDQPSPDRRDGIADPLCGGCLYAHVAYLRQLQLKAQIVADAFARIARLDLPPVTVAASPDTGYRMRARLHVRAGRIGFFREGTHEMCDARATRQLLPETSDVLDRLSAALRSLGVDAVRDVDVSENIPASQRAIHLELSGPVDPRPLTALAAQPSVSGLMLGSALLGGDPHVVDTLAIEGRSLSLRRHVKAFFQGNRFLLDALVTHVAGHIPRGAEVVDLYAGVGLFSLAAAGLRDAHVEAVEGDRTAARDLAFNAGAAGGAIDAVHQPVESFRRSRARPDVVIVDPPRTGMSRQALEIVAALGARSIVYVSCDVATLARDARRLIEAGYTLGGASAFDLFPNTPHVETVVMFDSPRQ